MTKAEQRKRDVQNALDVLRKLLKPGDTVHTALRHRSASGMTRYYEVYRMRENDAVCLTGWLAILMDCKRYDDKGIRVGGAGFDGGYELVEDLSRAVFGNKDGHGKFNHARLF